MALGYASLLSSPPLRLPKLAATKEARPLIEALRIKVFEASSDSHLQAACNLRVCSFNNFPQTYRIEEHQQYLSAIELEALKEKVEGKRPGFGKVTCVVATVSSRFADIDQKIALLCKLTGIADGVVEDQVVVGSLDLNRTPRLPDEMCGSHPQGVEGQYRRGYLSNVCVAKAFQRNGVGTRLIKYARMLALKQGISDLYTHVAVDNESAKRLYIRSGFVLEKEERASEARLMGRPARLLLWTGLSNC
ncbi:hypothetical protein GOP47_0007059 [Adiantum capillus-veneris]|uniref:N-acetyltransferase domain-containing protein n=1 Tax=Adiantum capillus-veneris TaxID=13818 RepID=A0A9D4UZZ4_ADICA|nr:hypothetical protein GOP47_0007059 [Adiantum capillus-veneris]